MCDRTNQVSRDVAIPNLTDLPVVGKPFPRTPEACPMATKALKNSILINQLNRIMVDIPTLGRPGQHKGALATVRSGARARGFGGH